MVTIVLMCLREGLMQSKFAYWDDQSVEASAVLMY